MSALHATQIANKSEHYVDLFDTDDTDYIKKFFQENEQILATPLLNVDDMRKFRQHFKLSKLSREDEKKTFEELYIPLGKEFQQEFNITFALIEGQHRSYSSLIGMLTARYDFDTPQGTALKPNSLDNKDFKYFLKSHPHANTNCDVQKILNNKSELPVLKQKLNVFIRCCTTPITRREQCLAIMERLEQISKDYHDDKISSSFKSASCTIATVFSALYSMLDETKISEDGTEYNPHAQVASPRWALEQKGCGPIFNLDSYKEFVREPSLPSAKKLIDELAEKNINEESKKITKLPYFLSCDNMINLEGLSPKMGGNSQCHYDAAELNTFIAAPLFHKAIYEAMEGKKYDNIASQKLQHFLEHQNRTVYPEEISKGVDTKFGTPRPEQYYQHMEDIQAVRFCCLLLNYALSVVKEDDTSIFNEIIRSLDRAEQHQTESAKTSLYLYGTFLQ